MAARWSNETHVIDLGQKLAASFRNWYRATRAFTGYALANSYTSLFTSATMPVALHSSQHDRTDYVAEVGGVHALDSPRPLCTASRDVSHLDPNCLTCTRLTVCIHNMA
jgi:hypothetical protein